MRNLTGRPGTPVGCAQQATSVVDDHLELTGVGVPDPHRWVRSAGPAGFLRGRLHERRGRGHLLVAVGGGDGQLSGRRSPGGRAWAPPRPGRRRPAAPAGRPGPPVRRRTGPAPPGHARSASPAGPGCRWSCRRRPAVGQQPSRARTMLGSSRSIRHLDARDGERDLVVDGDLGMGDGLHPDDQRHPGGQSVVGDAQGDRGPSIVGARQQPDLLFGDGQPVLACPGPRSGRRRRSARGCRPGPRGFPRRHPARPRRRPGR